MNSNLTHGGMSSPMVIESCWVLSLLASFSVARVEVARKRMNSSWTVCFQTMSYIEIKVICFCRLSQGALVVSAGLLNN